MEKPKLTPDVIKNWIILLTIIVIVGLIIGLIINTQLKVYFATEEAKKQCQTGYSVCGYSTNSKNYACYNPKIQSCCDSEVRPGGSDRECCGEKTCNSNERCCEVNGEPLTIIIPTCYDPKEYSCEHIYPANSNPRTLLRPI